MENYKQKYEQAMLRMNKWVEGSEIIDPKEVAEFVFPELKESEDDVMRKMAIKAVYAPEAQSCIKSWGINPSDVIAWLEEQGEQKPIDKVEPKFKVGDWVVHNYSSKYHDVNQIVQVKKLDDETFGYTLDNDNYFSGSFENGYHLWTIQDAKDGDVLTCYGNVKGKTIEQTGIFKEYVGRHGGCYNSFMVYIGVDWDDNIRINDYMGSTDIFPATKEQRDLFFSKLKEAGYLWNAVKKELKRIVQKPAWSEEDEKGLGDALWAVEQAMTIAKDENALGCLWYAEKWLQSLKKRMKRK